MTKKICNHQLVDAGSSLLCANPVQAKFTLVHAIVGAGAGLHARTAPVIRFLLPTTPSGEDWGGEIFRAFISDSARFPSTSAHDSVQVHLFTSALFIVDELFSLGMWEPTHQQHDQQQPHQPHPWAWQPPPRVSLSTPQATSAQYEAASPYFYAVPTGYGGGHQFAARYGGVPSFGPALSVEPHYYYYAAVVPAQALAQTGRYTGGKKVAAPKQAKAELQRLRQAAATREESRYASARFECTFPGCDSRLNRSSDARTHSRNFHGEFYEMAKAKNLPCFLDRYAFQAGPSGPSKRHKAERSPSPSPTAPV
ncbi:hypothetical protein T492DRAFT_1123262 [Pavlovales sp. CCMP2436]|nr:hypothetical protein T492DRAFT_1123262 [Pavlovales sp. CCMP2436]